MGVQFFDHCYPNLSSCGPTEWSLIFSIGFRVHTLTGLRSSALVSTPGSDSKQSHISPVGEVGDKQAGG